MRRLWFTLAYWLTRPRWDTGIIPPELIHLIETKALPAGRALDLGCGTGTNAVYLAGRGWQVVGIDFIAQAVEAARRKAAAAGVRAEFHQANVTQLDFLEPPFDLALDIGCFHSLPAGRRSAYMAEIARLLRPGGLFLCYAFKPEAPPGGIAVADMLRLAGGGFESVQVAHGEGTPSTWYTFRRL